MGFGSFGVRVRESMTSGLGTYDLGRRGLESFSFQKFKGSGFTVLGFRVRIRLRLMASELWAFKVKGDDGFRLLVEK